MRCCLGLSKLGVLNAFARQAQTDLIAYTNSQQTVCGLCYDTNSAYLSDNKLEQKILNLARWGSQGLPNEAAFEAPGASLLRLNIPEQLSPSRTSHPERWEAANMRLAPASPCDLRALRNMRRSQRPLNQK